MLGRCLRRHQKTPAPTSRSKRAPSSPKAMPIAEEIRRPRPICGESSVGEAVAGMAAEMVAGGDCVGLNIGFADVTLVGGLVYSMLALAAVSVSSSIV